MMTWQVTDPIDAAAKAAGAVALISTCWLTYGELTVRHAPGSDIRAAHAAAMALPNVRILRTERQGSQVVSVGYVVEA